MATANGDALSKMMGVLSLNGGADAQITRDQFNAMMRSIGQGAFSDTELDAVWSIMDKNGKGMVPWADFVTWTFVRSRSANFLPANQWRELTSDEEVKQLNGSGQVPLGKMRLNVPADKKGAIAIIACGSFSPPTLAHFRVLEDGKDTLEAKGIHVVGGFMSPAHIAYGKKSLAANYHRMNMVGLTLQHSDWISADPWECSQQGWTETAKVIDRYQQDLDDLHKSGQLTMKASACLLGGADLVESMASKRPDGTQSWSDEDVEKIVSRGVICLAREGLNLDDVIKANPILSRFKDNIHVVIPPIENNISSSLIRSNMKNGASIKYVVHDSTIEYIKKHRLNELPNWQ